MLQGEGRDLFLPFKKQDTGCRNVTCLGPAAISTFGNKHLLKFMRCPSNSLGALKACGSRPSPKGPEYHAARGQSWFWCGHWRDDDANPTWGLAWGKSRQGGRSR